MCVVLYQSPGLGRQNEAISNSHALLLEGPPVPAPGFAGGHYCLTPVGRGAMRQRKAEECKTM